ncbi:MAG: TVP38/TMEM64 family protein, partial [Planctomycetota bacterium]
KEQLDAFLAWVEGVGVWGPVIIGLFYIPATVLFIPGSAITLGAGAVFGVLWGTIAVSVGSTLGSVAAFLVGRFFAREWVESKVRANPRFKAIDSAVEQNGFKIVLLTRLSPVFPYNLLGYFYGVTNVRLRDYFFASWIGMFPGTLMYVYLGSVGGAAIESAAGAEGQKTLGEWALLVVGGIATIIVTVFVTKIARKALADAVPDTDNNETPPDAEVGVES